MNDRRAYDVDPHVAEIYDQVETGLDDVTLLRRLIGQGKRRIFEPFFGTGRIAIPLAEDGHDIVGMERAEPMLDRARRMMERRPEEVRERIRMSRGDVLETPWPEGFDLVLLGGNCFYELHDLAEQERCIALASCSLRPGGFVYVDNDHMEGDLDPAWRRPPGKPRRAFPSGICADKTKVDGTTETLEYDVAGRTVRYRRTATVLSPDGGVTRYVWEEVCHPPGTVEVKGWLESHGFEIERHFGDRRGSPYRDDSPRSIFWARKQGDAKR